MKTLNLNKLTILLGLFLVSAFFTTGANAGCILNADGEIVTNYSTNTPVQDDFATGTDTSVCRVTPDIYELKFYKYGICKTDPSFGDLSSCSLIFNVGEFSIPYQVYKGETGVLNIRPFSIEPGVYPYSYIEISNAVGIRLKEKMASATSGSSADGVHCWTTVGKTSSARFNNSGSSWTSSAHGAVLAYNAVALECGPSLPGSVLIHDSIINKLSSANCTDNFLANGDRTVQTSNPYREDNKFGVGQGLGVSTVSLLTTDNTFATDCTDSAKLAWTTNLDTAYTITEDSTYGMLVKTTDAAILAFDSNINNDIASMIAFPPEITLQVTD